MPTAEPIGRQGYQINWCLLPGIAKMSLLSNTANAAFPLSRSAPQLESWSQSWTNHAAGISSYQIFMSIVVVVLIAEHFWAVQKSSTISTINF